MRDDAATVLRSPPILNFPYGRSHGPVLMVLGQPLDQSSLMGLVDHVVPQDIQKGGRG